MIMTIVGTKTSDKTVTTRTEVLKNLSAGEPLPRRTVRWRQATAAWRPQGITGYSTKSLQADSTENGKTTEVLANSSTYSKRDEVVYVGE